MYQPDDSPPEEERLKSPSKTEPLATSDIAELRQILDELTRRFNEIEFERIERNRMRGEIGKLEMRLQETMGQLAERLGENERLVADLSHLPVGPTAEEFAKLKSELSAVNLDKILQTIQDLEEKAESLRESGSQPDPRILEVLHKLEDRLGVLESSNAGQTGDNASDADNLKKALEELAELRVSLQNVTVRYSEIGELKKNHLILLNKMESLQHNLETSRREPSNGMHDKIGQMEKEVSALRAEVRQALNGFEEGGSSPEHGSTELEKLKAEIVEFAQIQKEEKERIQTALSGLESKIKDSSRTGTRIPERIESLATYIRRIEQQYQSLTSRVEEALQSSEGTTAKIEKRQRDIHALKQDNHQFNERLAALESRTEDLILQVSKGAQPPLHADMHAIRENLDEIRNFISNIASKD
jgi:chromosome segregation ATPase